MTTTAAGERILMVRDDLDGLPPAIVPSGYRIRTMTPGDLGLWVDIVRNAEPYYAISEATFHDAFGMAPEQLVCRGFIAEDAQGRGVGTTAAWFDGETPETECGRLHWVAVRPGHQGRGVGKALCLVALWAMRQWHGRVVLVTQSKRTAAIALYRKLGFQTAT